MAASKSEHAGHRQRMKNKYLKHGIEIFDQHEILEMLLYYAIPMRDTNSLAHKLINKFGSISAVMDAPYSLLTEFGLSENVAFFLKFLPDVLAIYRNDKIENTSRVIDLDVLPQRLINLYFSKEVEMAYIILMDRHFKEVFSGFVSKGSSKSTELSIPIICEAAIRHSARFAIIAHNHPSGTTKPSKSDIISTINLFQALDNLDIVLLDHFVISGNDFLSMFDSGYIFKSKEEYMTSPIYKDPFFP